MRNLLDQLAKKVGKEALGPSGPTIVQYEISRDAQQADIWHDPNPARSAERARLGLLGELASVPCLIEVYGHAPSSEELRACLTKHFTHWQGRTQKARAANKKRKEKGSPIESSVDPWLWIIAATVSAPMLRKLGARRKAGWPPGVRLFGEDLFRAGIVVASELPRDRSTLLVRIMAAGPHLPEAITELHALPPDAHERAVAETIVIHLQRAVANKPSRTPEEEEFAVKMQGTWDTWEKGMAEALQQGRKQGHKEGLQEGRVAAAADAILTTLEVRNVDVPESARQRIRAEQSRTQLKMWLKRAIVADSIADVLGEPS